ncbi:MAG: phospholipid carrier-dependent glycosyltransferase [Candidatus Scalindua sp.]
MFLYPDFFTMTKKGLFSLAILFLFLYIVSLNVRPVVTPDETRYGEISREMLDTGDFIVPRLDGLRYFEKPVLGYWLNAASMALFGDNGFAIRLPSALAVGLTALILFLVVKRFHGCDKAALLSAFIYMTFMEVYGVGTFCALDSLLTFFLAAALGCFFVAGTNKSVRHRNVWLLLCGVFCGAAFLTKGFLAFVLPALTVIPFLLWERRGRELFTLLWLPLLSVVAVALPWCLMIASREPDFWHYFFWHEHVQRFLSAEGGMHNRPFWFLIPFFLAGAFPWILVIPVAIGQYKRELLLKPLVRFCICWMTLSLVFFSASSGKMITYILPCFPPLAALTAIGLTEYFKQDGKRMFKYCSSSLVIIMGIVIVSLLLIAFTPALYRRIYGLGEVYKLWYCVCAAVLCFVIMFKTVLTRDRRWKTVTHGLSAAVIMLAFPFAVPAENSIHAGMTTFLRSQQGHITTDTVLLTDFRSVHAICYVYKRKDAYLFLRKSELGYGLSYPDSAWRYIDTDGLKKLLNERGKRQIAVIINKTTLSRADITWPDPVYQTVWKDVYFAVY